VTEPGIDWKEARAFLRRRVSVELRFEDPATLEDVCQDSLVRLLRASRSMEIRNLEALMTEIARRACISHIRSARVKRDRFTPLEDDAPEPEDRSSDGAGLAVDPVARLCFMVLEFLRGHDGLCHQIARLRAQGVDMSEIAGRVGRSHDAVRKHWSRRCWPAVLAEIGPDDELLVAWREQEA
jgi:hypothetical protein